MTQPAGVWNVSVRAFDAEGNFSVARSENTVVDTTKPALTVSSPREGARVRTRAFAVTFSASDPTLFRVTCSVDGATAEECTSPYQAHVGTDGAHTVTVRAMDGAGNTTSVTRHVTVDTSVLVASGPRAAVLYGTSFRLHASLPADATGTVNFGMFFLQLCSVPVVNGSADCIVPGKVFGAGQPIVFVGYTGDTTYASASAVVSVTITPRTTAISASAQTATYGRTNPLRAGGLLGTATGTVEFRSADGSVVCRANVKQGRGTASCSATRTAFAPGSYSVTAAYLGDANHVASSAVFALTVAR